MTTSSNSGADAIDRLVETAAALDDSERQLAIELAGAKALHAISTRLISESNPDALYVHVLDAAMEIMAADAASIQMLAPEAEALTLLGSRNLHPLSVEWWNTVSASSITSCGRALRDGTRVVVSDVEQWGEIAGTRDAEEYQRSMVRAVQSTPLVSRAGRPLGIISTHWHSRREPAERELRLFDVLARQAADLIERTHAEAAQRAGEERAALLLKLTDALRPLVDSVAIQECAARFLGEHLGASRVGYAEDQGDDTIVVTRHYTNGVPGIEGHYRYDDYGPALLEAFRAGRAVVRPDIASDPSLTDAEKAAHAALQLGATLNVPLVKEGRLRAVLFAHYQKPRAFTRSEVTLLEEVADRIWEAVERARSEAALKSAHAELERRVRERTAALAEANAALAREQAQIQSLFKRVIAAQEEERRRIARDLHDQLGQQMTGLRLAVEALQNHAGAAEHVIAGQAKALQTLAAELDHSIDALTWQLRPVVLDQLGLPAALGNLVNDWSCRTQIDAELTAVGTARPLSADVETHLYRIAQEALQNVFKHAWATHVSVVLEYRKERVQLVIEDNGRGFEAVAPAPSSPGAGLGVTNMRERAGIIQGDFEIESSPDTGTTIFVRVPLEPVEPRLQPAEPPPPASPQSEC